MNDTRMQESAVCPYCGHSHTQSDLAVDGLVSEDQTTIACEECGKDFHLVGYCSWLFTTLKAEAP